MNLSVKRKVFFVLFYCFLFFAIFVLQRLLIKRLIFNNDCTKLVPEAHRSDFGGRVQYLNCAYADNRVQKIKLNKSSY